MAEGSRRHHAGNAMLTAVISLALAGVIAAALVESSRFQLRRAKAYADGAKAYYAAEAGVAAALSALPAGLRFDTSLLGEDQLAGTADDGILPYGSLLDGLAEPGSGSLELQVSDDADDSPADPFGDTNERILLRSTATVGRRARRVLLAVIGRAPSPYNPAAVIVTGPSIYLADDFVIDGRNHDLTVGCTSLAGGPAGFGMAVASPDAIEALSAELALTGAGQVVGAGGVPSLSLLRSVELACVRDATGDAGSDLPGGELAGTIGDVGNPALVVVRGNASVSGNFQGAGALVVLGGFTVASTAEFSGVVIATGGVRVTSGGSLSICGSLWTEGALENRGSLRVRYSEAAVAVADSRLRLPRLPKLLAVREDF